MDPVGDILPWANLGVGGLILLGFIRGWIYSSRGIERIITTFEARLKDKDEQIQELRSRANALDARNDLLARQVQSLVEVGHTAGAVLTSLPTGKEVA